MVTDTPRAAGSIEPVVKELVVPLTLEQAFELFTTRIAEWWRDINFGGTSWQWPTDTWVSYVGDNANDQFSAVANVP